MNPMDRRVVITGIGVVTPVGNDIETFWGNLRNGVSGIELIQAFDTTAYDCRIAGEVRNFEPKNFFKNPKDVRRTDRYAGRAATRVLCGGKLSSAFRAEESDVSVHRL